MDLKKMKELRPLTDGQEPVLMPMAAKEREGLRSRFFNQQLSFDDNKLGNVID